MSLLCNSRYTKCIKYTINGAVLMSLKAPICSQNQNAFTKETHCHRCLPRNSVTQCILISRFAIHLLHIMRRNRFCKFANLNARAYIRNVFTGRSFLRRVTLDVIETFILDKRNIILDTMHFRHANISYYHSNLIFLANLPPLFAKR